MEGRPKDPNFSAGDYGVAHSSPRQGCELAEQRVTASNPSEASSSSSSPGTCQYVDASSSLPTEVYQHASAPPPSKDTCFLPVVDGGFCNSQVNSQVPIAHRVHFGPIPLEYTQKQPEEHEHHPSCSFSKDSQNDIFQDKNLAERQVKVQITMQEARERISQLVQPRQDDKHSGTHLLERLMQMVENRKFVRNLALTLVSFCKKVYGWRPWRNSLKEIEGKFGSAVLLTFVFLRFVLFLNAILTVLWIVSIVIPFLINPPKSFSWVHFFDIGFKSFFQEAFLTAG
ncbi:hypothetical protein L7F22_010649 [Adiantum nelumboides]|nr:hypothetical protein [Adiantum nelumboides]